MLKFAIYCKYLEVFKGDIDKIVWLKLEHFNPIGYKRGTQTKVKFDKGYKIYQAWQKHCYESFVSEFLKEPHELLKPKQKYHFSVKMYFLNDNRSDPDNIYKGIVDALCKQLNDRYITGAFDYYYDVDNPRVEVIITENKLELFKALLWLYEFNFVDVLRWIKEISQHD